MKTALGLRKGDHKGDFAKNQMPFGNELRCLNNIQTAAQEHHEP